MVKLPKHQMRDETKEGIFYALNDHIQITLQLELAVSGQMETPLLSKYMWRKKRGT